MADSNALPVTSLFGLNLSPGKVRGLQRISNPNGTFTMVATDQNSAMIWLMQKSTVQSTFRPAQMALASRRGEPISRPSWPTTQPQRANLPAQKRTDRVTLRFEVSSNQPRCSRVAALG